MYITNQAQEALVKLSTASALALGTQEVKSLIRHIELGLYQTPPSRLVDDVLRHITKNFECDRTEEIREGLECAPKLILELLPAVWTPKTRPTVAEVYYRINDTHHRIDQLLEQTRNSLNAPSVSETMTGSVV